MSKSKVAMVTGGSGGIGGEICRRLASDGYRVLVHYGSSKDEAEQVVQSIADEGGEAFAVSADVSQEAQVVNLFKECAAKFGAPSVVVANAGIATDGPVEKFALEDFERVVGINFKGAFLTLREGARVLGKGGRLIFISSALSARPMPGVGVYSATKAAVDALVVAMSKELGERGITVNSVQPGPVVPGMFDRRPDEEKEKFRQMTPLQRIGSPAEIAAVVSFLAGPDGGWITGQQIRADGGLMN